jgi:hypothetical protein
MAMCVTRSGFLVALAAVVAIPADAASVEIPVVLEGGRFFATPRVARDGSVMRLWLDTDGDGFMFSESIARWALPVIADPKGMARTWTRLPAFVQSASVPAPVARDGRLIVFARDDGARRDPILNGFDGQLGASWFQDRTWTFDYRARRLMLRGPLRDDDGTTVPVRFATGPDGRRIDGGQYPRVTVVVDGTAHVMSFDTAASVALNPAARDRIDGGLPALRATSFIRRSLLAAWRSAHPDWPALDDVSVQAGMAAIRVPSLRLGSIELGPVWFTTRPGDDVFEDEANLDGKLGASAFSGRAVTLDYPRALLAVR